jgi:CHAT domain-containing protein
MADGMSAFQRGASEQAAISWGEAARLYEQAGNLPGQLDALNLLSQAYQGVGQYKQAFQALEYGLAMAVQSGDRPRSAVLQAGLGNAYLAVGKMDAASEYLTQALGLAGELKNDALSAAVLNSQGNLWATQKKYAEAREAYTKSSALAKAAGDGTLAASATINAATAALQQGRHNEAKGMLDQALAQLRPLGPSHDTAYGLINLALAYNDLRPALPNANEPLLLQTSTLLTEAAGIADRIGDLRASSYAWGHLGRLYETERRYPEALGLTRHAIFAAQQVNSTEALYRWHWQSGRVFYAQGNLNDALSAYGRAAYTLDPLRQEMSFGAGGAQASLRDSVKPFLFEYADLLLKRAAQTSDRKESEPYLLKAREAVESLKAAELRDYFRDDCVDALQSSVTPLDQISKTAAVVYPIIFPDRTELLVSLPSGLKRITVAVKESVLTEEIRAFRKRLEKRTTRQYLPHAQQLYEWLIRPLEADLQAFKIDTLVFVPDGPLRTIPMAALHDGKDFLIQKYAVATTPGLNLTDPRPIRRDAIKLLTVGLTESVQGFPPLPNVSDEIKAVQALYGGESLVNRDFQAGKLERELKESRVSIVHIASHGKFERDVEKSFLLTFDDKLNMERLSRYVGLFRFRDEPLELLTLSACETAVGDDRAALGLAGVAIKAGARSALATLWFINDEASSALVAEFYKQFQDRTVSKAAALQRAQLKMLEDPAFKHPGYWAPFLLLNNWL